MSDDFNAAEGAVTALKKKPMCGQYRFIIKPKRNLISGGLDYSRGQGSAHTEANCSVFHPVV